MKNKKIILPILSVAGLATAVTPLVMLTSCNNDPKSLEFTNNTLHIRGTDKYGFGMPGTYNKGTTYNFTADLSKWTTDFGKPAEANWKNLSVLYFIVLGNSVQTNKVKFNNKDKIMVTVNDVELTTGWEVLEPGNNDYIYIRIVQDGGEPIKYNDKIVFKNICSQTIYQMWTFTSAKKFLNSKTMKKIFYYTR